MTGAIIQASMLSKRLPGKSLMDIGGKSMLTRIVERVRRAKSVGKIVVATTKHKKDDAIAEECGRLNIGFIRGVRKQVLHDYYAAAHVFSIDPAIRITGDCPLIDPYVIDAIVKVFMSDEYDYVSNIPNLFGRTLPRGLDVEVISFTTLKWLHENITPEKLGDEFHKDYVEHVTFYIRENPDKFKAAMVKNSFAMYRWTVDRQNELDFVRKIYDEMGDSEFTWIDVIRFLNDHPELIITETAESQATVKGGVW